MTDIVYDNFRGKPTYVTVDYTTMTPEVLQERADDGDTAALVEVLRREPK